MRRPNTVPWGHHHGECLLEMEKVGKASDYLLCQVVQITLLMQEISSQLHLYHLATFVDSDATMNGQP